EKEYIGAIAMYIEPIAPNSPIPLPFDRFIENQGLRVLPVVEKDRIIGILHRNKFLENKILGRYGYGMALNNSKKVKDLQELPSLVVEIDTPVEEVAQRIQLRKTELLYDDVCITHKGKYFGIVHINVLLDALTERNLLLAKGTNPLTGLPGNEFIQREINKRILREYPFDVCYFDLDNFKPYNDHYGFEKGDVVIKTLALIMTEVAGKQNGENTFVGHIGGDDFIIVTTPRYSEEISYEVIEKFERQLSRFHGGEDCSRGYYIAQNRKEETEKIRLLSLSVGIVSSQIKNISSYAQIASLSSEIKKKAKKIEGSSVVKDKRDLNSATIPT
ncbi:MAG: GGDEF domain-containing protein, partial [Nitrospinae bacterium]|nr:GGDEF domain-containing protein [Nitrospinota bacterium]